MHQALINWGAVLSDLAALSAEPYQEALLNEEIEKYSMAVAIKPDDYVTLYNWAYALGNLADLREGPDREALLREAVEKCAMAAEIKPDDYSVLNNWAYALEDLVGSVEEPDLEALLKAAIEKCTRAAEINPRIMRRFTTGAMRLGSLHIFIKVGKELKPSMRLWRKQSVLRFSCRGQVCTALHVHMRCSAMKKVLSLL